MIDLIVVVVGQMMLVMWDDFEKLLKGESDETESDKRRKISKKSNSKTNKGLKEYTFFL